jgi:hypothetical protein
LGAISSFSTYIEKTSIKSNNSLRQSSIRKYSRYHEKIRAGETKNLSRVKYPEGKIIENYPATESDRTTKQT